jgi:hypothetical protein
MKLQSTYSLHLSPCLTAGFFLDFPEKPSFLPFFFFLFLFGFDGLDFALASILETLWFILASSLLSSLFSFSR